MVSKIQGPGHALAYFDGDTRTLRYNDLVTILLKQIYKFFKLLNSETGHNQIAAGISLGMILGFTPSFSLQSVLVFFCIFIFRVQAGAAFLAAFFFAFPAYLFDGVFHWVGAYTLTFEPLKPLFTSLYHMPIVPMTRFYNSIVMGSGLVAIALTPFMFFGSRWVIFRYREQIVARFKETKVWKLFAASKLYFWYQKYDHIFGQDA
jgi:uncharacterized protein (TIGR03546 family)